MGTQKIFLENPAPNLLRGPLPVRNPSAEIAGLRGAMMIMGLNQQQLADKAGLSQPALDSIMQGRSVARMDARVRILRVLQLDIHRHKFYFNGTP